MKRIGIIDVGSNSARLVIMEISSQKGSHLVYNQKDPLRLALKTDPQGYLTEEAFTSTIDCIRGFASMCRFFHVTDMVAVATAAIRNAKNGMKTDTGRQGKNRCRSGYHFGQDGSLYELRWRRQYHQCRRCCDF